MGETTSTGKAQPSVGSGVERDGDRYDDANSEQDTEAADTRRADLWHCLNCHTALLNTPTDQRDCPHCPGSGDVEYMGEVQYIHKDL